MSFQNESFQREKNSHRGSRIRVSSDFLEATPVAQRQCRNAFGILKEYDFHLKFCQISNQVGLIISK